MFEICLDLCIVLSRHFTHPLQIGVNLVLFTDFLDVTLTFLFDFVDVPFECGDHLAHLLLIHLLFAQLILKHGLTLDELLTVTIQVADLFTQIRVLTNEFFRFLLFDLLHGFELECLILNLLVFIADLA